MKIFNKKPILFVRITLILTSAILGFLIGKEYWHNDLLSYVGLLFGFTIGFIVVSVEKSMESISTKKILTGGIGLFIGLFIINYITYQLFKDFFTGSNLGYITYAFVNFLAGYLGLIIGLRVSEDFNMGVKHQGAKDSAGRMQQDTEQCRNYKVIDTSSLIDGRILDVSKTGFIDGTFVIPTFVLHELQHIADSQDPLKRVKGRRGLDILKELREDKNINIQFTDADYPNIKEVDAKLIAFAKEKAGKIITTDFNLNKVAQVRNISVLNINDLVKALRPIFLPGEIMTVLITKEGREKNQGIAYMDDGTMVVVEDAIKLVGVELNVTVTSVLQTSSGRMIFAKLNYDKEQAVN
ncbi:MAG: PIN domain-containing protein [bacterium]